MKKTFLILITSVIFGGFFASCSANRGFVSSLTRADIRQVQQFEPLNYVGIIEKGNKITYSDSLTTVAQGLFETALSKDRTLPVTGTIIIEDSLINNKVQYEIYMLMNYVENNIRVKDIPIPPVIDSVLEARNERFGLLAYNWGFTRTGSNYAGQIGKGVLIGVLTLGTVYTVPYKDMVRNGGFKGELLEHHGEDELCRCPRHRQSSSPKTGCCGLWHSQSGPTALFRSASHRGAHPGHRPSSDRGQPW